MPKTYGLLVVAIASIGLGACGGARGDHGARAPVSAIESARSGTGSICGEALARVMERAFISPASSTAVRLRARATIDLIAAHATSVEPVCSSRSSVEPTVAAR